MSFQFNFVLPNLYMLLKVLRNGFTDEKKLMSVTHSASVSLATMFLTNLSEFCAKLCKLRCDGKCVAFII